MWPKTYLYIIFTILLLTSIEYIGPTGGQSILLDLSLEPELTAEALTSSNDTAPIHESKDSWILINHDIYGTRNSNQTTIGKDNVDKLQVKWRWLSEYEIQDPPIIR